MTNVWNTFCYIPPHRLCPWHTDTMAIHRVREASGIKWQITCSKSVSIRCTIIILLVAQFIDGNGLCQHTGQNWHIDIWSRICIHFLKIFCCHLVVNIEKMQFSLNVHGIFNQPSNAFLRILRKWRHILPHMSRSVLYRCGRDWPNHSSWARIRGMNDRTAKSNPLWSAWESLLSFDARCFVRVLTYTMNGHGVSMSWSLSAQVRWTIWVQMGLFISF